MGAATRGGALSRHSLLDFIVVGRFGSVRLGSVGEREGSERDSGSARLQRRDAVANASRPALLVIAALPSCAPGRGSDPYRLAGIERRGRRSRRTGTSLSTLLDCVVGPRARDPEIGADTEKVDAPCCFLTLGWMALGGVFSGAVGRGFWRTGGGGVEGLGWFGDA